MCLDILFIADSMGKHFISTKILLSVLIGSLSLLILLYFPNEPSLGFMPIFSIIEQDLEIILISLLSCNGCISTILILVHIIQQLTENDLEAGVSFFFFLFPFFFSCLCIFHIYASTSDHCGIIPGTVISSYSFPSWQMPSQLLEVALDKRSTSFSGSRDSCISE